MGNIPANAGSNLAVGHLISSLNDQDTFFHSIMVKAFNQLAFGLTRTKNLDCISTTNYSDNAIIEAVQVVPKLSVAHILC
jgi:hypothetical protein